MAGMRSNLYCSNATRDRTIQAFLCFSTYARKIFPIFFVYIYRIFLSTLKNTGRPGYIILFTRLFLNYTIPVNTPMEEQDGIPPMTTIKSAIYKLKLKFPFRCKSGELLMTNHSMAASPCTM